MFELNAHGELEYLAIREFLERGVLAVFSLRAGGSSSPPYDGLNMGTTTGDSKETVLRNRRRLFEALGIEPGRVIGSRQVHGTRVLEVDMSLQGRPLVGDGLITRDKRAALIGYFADCTPLYFIDTRTGAYGLAHAGWRGTLGRIAVETVKAMERQFGSKPEHIMAGIGPCIGKCCYEVGEQVAKAFGVIRPDPSNGTYRLDLVEQNRRQLMEAGIDLDAIIDSGYCTACNSRMFFSHRASGGRTGRMAALITASGFDPGA